MKRDEVSFDEFSYDEQSTWLTVLWPWSYLEGVTGSNPPEINFWLLKNLDCRKKGPSSMQTLKIQTPHIIYWPRPVCDEPSCDESSGDETSKYPCCLRL